MSNITPFSFEQHAVRTIEKDGQAWFVLNDVTDALEFTRGRDAARMLDDDEKGAHIVRVPSSNQHGAFDQEVEVTIINESGLYSLILKSRKASAKRFKKWVTAEVLPTIRKTGSYTAPTKRQPKALPHGLTLDQQDAVKALVKARVEALPQAKQAKAAITCWSALKSKFGCTYKAIEPEQFTEAVSLVARLPLEGELLEPEKALPLALHYPARLLLELNPHLRSEFGKERICLGVDALCGMDARSPTLKLIGELARAGHDVEGCKLELLAMRHHLESYRRLAMDLHRMGEAHSNAGLSFPLC